MTTTDEMRKPPLTATDQVAELSRILAAGILRLRPAAVAIDKPFAATAIPPRTALIPDSKPCSVSPVVNTSRDPETRSTAAWN